MPPTPLSESSPSSVAVFALPVTALVVPVVTYPALFALFKAKVARVPVQAEPFQLCPSSQRVVYILMLPSGDRPAYTVPSEHTLPMFRHPVG